MASKVQRGQFYTTNAPRLMTGMPKPPPEARCVIEPFGGQGDLVRWAQENTKLKVKAFDIEPKAPGIKKRDTLMRPPIYKDAWVITNPPYLCKANADDKRPFELYDTNDLFRAFIVSLAKQKKCMGGVFILPVSFFNGTRPQDVACRNLFMKRYVITYIKYYETQTFKDTLIPIVVFSFERSKKLMKQQVVKVKHFPSKNIKYMTLSKEHGWVPGGEWKNIPKDLKLPKVETLSSGSGFLLTSADSGPNRIHLSVQTDPVSRSTKTYQVLKIHKQMTAKEKQAACEAFNNYVELARKETFSMFLMTFKQLHRKQIQMSFAKELIGLCAEYVCLV